jgi:excisionase family DNA binding protein
MTDTNASSQTVTDTDTDIAAVTEDMTTVAMVTTEEAARLAGVSVRTIRRWIQYGYLPVVEDESGKLVSPADLPEARRRAGRGHGRGH